MRVADVAMLYEYYDWATNKILDAANRLSAEQFVAPPIADRSLRSTLVHTLSAERGWRSGWQGRGRPPRLQDEDSPTVAALTSRWQEEAQQMREYLATLQDADLDQPSLRGTLGQVLLHVANHGTQHRSEAAMLLTAYGRSPGDLDLIFFLRERQP